MTQNNEKIKKSRDLTEEEMELIYNNGKSIFEELFLEGTNDK